MIRSILVSIFFFIGPAMLMFMLRNVALLARAWLKNRQLHAHDPEIIDITPIHNHIHPNWFIIAVVIVSMTCAVAVFMQLQSNEDVDPHQYVPAHMDESGNIVPGGWQPK